MSENIHDYYEIRSWHGFVHETAICEGIRLERPLIKAVSAVIIANPYAGKPFKQDLSALTKPSYLLGAELGRRAMALVGGQTVEAYGKGGIAGLAGAQEHLVACKTTVFGDAFREAIGGGDAWISSASKVASAGTAIDIPLAFKDEVYVRDYYDAVTLAVPEGPKPDELLLCAAVSTGTRPNARLGGLTVEEALAALDK